MTREEITRMRTIKFRGKCCHSDAWAYGYLVDYGVDECSEIQGFDVFHEGRDVWQEMVVERNTVGQFTGLHDKNGKEIYEGDLVRYGERNYVVSYEDSHKGAFSLIRNNTFVGCFGTPYPFEPFYVEVVGNIHDYRKYPKGGEQ